MSTLLAAARQPAVAEPTVAELADLLPAGLPPIGLDELVRRASLLTRVDRKYVLAPVALPPLLTAVDALAQSARVLQIGDRRDFGYRSVYFDTPDLVSYRATAHRRRRRFKVRLRGYLDTGLDFVEVKIRGGRGVTSKDRRPYDGDGLRLGPDDRAYVDGILATASIPSVGPRLVPTLVTAYRRATLFLPGSGSRVTIDVGLCWALPDGTAAGRAGAVTGTVDRVVVETKSAGPAGEVDRLLWRAGHRPRPMSKYATGLAVLRPDLPANRWQPVLRRHFSVGQE
ncbi:polyphosphate polymerase domain-containing protein [Solwaraspora sp. WMMB335]|uniref:polyphosphate polymerase domain-containing protein n=1 Tax=Solwaraspora sp. WMMB335 TaxID=3404118 RepID=UPI003B92E0CC